MIPYNSWVVYSIGFVAQILFSSRLLIQWIISEKHKTVSTPSLFWILSLIASFMLFVYGDLRDDFAIMLGQSLTYFIYIRNLQLQNKWQKIPRFIRYVFVLLPVALVIYFFNNNRFDLNLLFKNDQIPFWLLILGVVSQVTFMLRFIYQWIYSERRKKSSLPIGFWILSNMGALLILTYAIFRKDPVLFTGHAIGMFIYSRNIILLLRTNDKDN